MQKLARYQRELLRDVLEGKEAVYELASCFTFDDTPQGHTYWSERAEGKKAFDEYDRTYLWSLVGGVDKWFVVVDGGYPYVFPDKATAEDFINSGVYTEDDITVIRGREMDLDTTTTYTIKEN